MILWYNYRHIGGGRMNCIEINQLTKYYSKVKGIEDVSFQVREGEIFGFIGPNGAGKSTTIRTLLGLIFPTSGSATIFGKDCITQGHEIRKDIGYLPSEVFYYEKMKVIDLLKYAGSFYKKDCSKRIYELSEIMELNLNRRIEDLSYGNKKKVGIVQGLLHEPKLIVLDEPTSGLDPLMQQRFFELIKSENKKGASVFFSSHILSEVQHLCNRVAIIKGGHVIQVEDVKTLREDTYKKITLIGESIDLKTFEIEGVTELNKSDHQLDFFYKGDVNLLVNKIQSLELKDILVENPSLEEIFMHYYK